MTAKLEDIAKLPGWPRWLSEEQAAAYVGVSVTMFREEVTAGVWPKGKNRGRGTKRQGCVRWDRAWLDDRSDAGLKSPAPRRAEPLEEAASRWAEQLR